MFYEVSDGAATVCNLPEYPQGDQAHTQVMKIRKNNKARLPQSDIQYHHHNEPQNDSKCGEIRIAASLGFRDQLLNNHKNHSPSRKTQSKGQQRTGDQHSCAGYLPHPFKNE